MDNALLDSPGFQLLFSATAEAFILVDRQGRVVLANPAACEMFGYPCAQFQGRSVESLIPDRLRSQHLHLRHQYLDKPHRRRVGIGQELVAQDALGREFPVEVSLSPMPGDIGEYTLVEVHNITLRHQLQQDAARDRSRQEFRTRLSTLTLRERDVMALVIQGFSNKKIALTLSISPRTVEIHRAHVMHKTGATNLLELARIAQLTESS